MKRIPKRSKTKLILIISVLAVATLLVVSAFLIAGRKDKSLLIPDSNATPADGKPESSCKTFLIVGKDRVGYNTDVIMLVSLSSGDNTAEVIQIPRDTYIEYNDKGIKLNALYGKLCVAAKSDGKGDPPKAALASLTTLLSEALGVRIDEYVLFDLNGFRDIVDAIGGITVDVPCDMFYEDPEQNLYIDLKAGIQTLDGEHAEQFIRCRSVYATADLGRIDAQKIFLSAFISKVQDGLTLKQILAVANSVFDNLATSVSILSIPELAVKALKVPLSSVKMFTAPGETTKSGVFYILNRDKMTDVLSTFPKNGKDFDQNKVFRGYNNDEIRGLYEK